MAANANTALPTDPILINEVNFPLEKVFVTSTGGQSDKVGKKIKEIGDKHGLFETISLTASQKKLICHDTIDLRDSFRVVVDNSNRSNMYSLVCLSTGGNNITWDRCTDNLLEKVTSIGLPVRNTIPYLYESSYDKLGNVVVSPPSEDHPHGIIIVGGQSDETINSIKGENIDALQFSWNPGCGIVSENNKDKLTARGNNTTKRNAYCASREVYDFSSDKGKNGFKGISPEFKEILSSFTKQKKVEIYTGWLEVGHADEIVSFVPFPKKSPTVPDGSTHGYKVLLASPKMFIDLWKTAAENKVTPKDKCLFRKLISSTRMTEIKQVREKTITGKANDQLLTTRKLNEYQRVGIPIKDIYCDMLISDFTNERVAPLIQFNLWLQSAILDKIKQQLILELKITSDDIIDIPILYIGPDELFGYYTKQLDEFLEVFDLSSPTTIEEFKEGYKSLFGNFGVYHLSNNFINSLYSSNYIISPILEDNIGIINYIKNAIIKPGYIDEIYDVVDEWNTIKYQHGGVHCYTTESRDLSNINTIFPPVASGGKRKSTRKVKKTRTKAKKNTKKH